MNTVHLVVSVKRSIDYDPSALCAFIEHWAATSNVIVKVSVEERTVHDCLKSDPENSRSELLFLKVEYENYPTMGNYIIEIKQFIRSATGLFGGIECLGINEA